MVVLECSILYVEKKHREKAKSTEKMQGIWSLSVLQPWPLVLQKGEMCSIWK